MQDVRARARCNQPTPNKAAAVSFVEETVKQRARTNGNPRETKSDIIMRTTEPK